MNDIRDHVDKKLEVNFSDFSCIDIHGFLLPLDTETEWPFEIGYEFVVS